MPSFRSILQLSMSWIYVNRKQEEQIANPDRKHKIHKKKKLTWWTLSLRGNKNGRPQLTTHSFMVTDGIVAFMFFIKRDDCQDILSSFLCFSPEQALVKNSAKKLFRIEAPSLRIFARAANHCYVDYLKHRTLGIFV